MSSVLDPGSLAEVNRAIEDAKALAYAESTRKSDKQRVDTFLRWCATTGLDPQTQAAEALQLYLVAAEGRWSKSHLVSVVAAVQRHHVARGWPNPADEATRAIARCLVSTYEQSPRLALPITVAEARALITVIPMVIRRSEYAQRRTSAQLRFALGGALRAGEASSTHLDELTWVEGGVLYRPTAAGSTKTDDPADPLPPIEVAAQPSMPDLCPVLAVREWISWAQPDGYLWRGDPRQHGTTRPHMSADSWAEIFRNLVAAAGLTGRITSHSLRATFVTLAIDAGASPFDIRRTTRWNDNAMVAHYLRRRSALDGPGHVVGRAQAP